MPTSLFVQYLARVFRSLLEKYEDSAEFYAPDVCFDQAREHLPAILEGRGIDANSALAVLKQLERLVEPVDRERYREHEQAARDRISIRDIDDWPVVAVAILLGLRSGRKIKTSSAAVSPHGRRIELSCICKRCNR